jgi:hypothetical protein
LVGRINQYYTTPRATPEQADAEATASREKRAEKARAEWEHHQRLAGKSPGDKAGQRRQA